jgi:hypothetical protein
MKSGVIVSRVEHVEGDERSKTNPGHGYPAHNVTRQEFKEFESEHELKQFLLYNENSLPRMRVIKFEDLVISKNIVIDIA